MEIEQNPKRARTFIFTALHNRTELEPLRKKTKRTQTEPL